MSVFGNYSKMFGGIFGGIISGAVTSAASAVFDTGSLIHGCSNAFSAAAGNWVGTVATMAINGALGAIVVYFMPKNKPKV